MPTVSPDPGTVARTRNALIGGPHNTAADRTLAAAITASWPQSGRRLAEATAFHTRVLLHAVTAQDRPARGLLIAGTGYPLGTDPHRAALAAVPQARAAYADPDPEAVAVKQAFLAGERVASYQAVARDPAALLSAPEAAALPRPLCVLLRLVLQYQPPEQAAGTVAEYARLLDPGSLLAMSVAIPSEADARKFSGLLAVAGTGLRLYAHQPADVAGWLDKAGLETLPPGVVDVRAWPDRGWTEAAFAQAGTGRIVGAVARVP